MLLLLSAWLSLGLLALQTPAPQQGPQALSAPDVARYAIAPSAHTADLREANRHGLTSPELSSPRGHHPGFDGSLHSGGAAAALQPPYASARAHGASDLSGKPEDDAPLGFNARAPPTIV